MWLLCSNRKFITKNDAFATMTIHNNIFCHRHSDHLHSTNCPFTYALRKDMSTLSRISKSKQFRKNVFNEISLKSNLNCTI